MARAPEPAPTAAPRRRAWLAAAGLLAAALLLGLLTPAPSPAAKGRLQGKVKSGKSGLGGFQVRLLQARPGAKRPKLLATATSNRGGHFALRYRGAARNAAHYLVAGRPDRGGGGSAAPASAYKLAASLGFGRLPRRATVDDRTTVAMTFAMAQFLSGARLSGTNPGLRNAAAMSANLIEPATGSLSPVLRRYPNGNATETLARFGSLANLLASCRGGGRACAALLSLGREPGGRPAADTLRALTAIARNPWHDAAGLYRRSRQARKPYRPALAAGERPSGWTLALRFEGRPGSVDGPGNIAVDSGGNLWVTNAFEFSSDPAASVCGGEELLRFAPDGSPHPGSPYRGGGLDGAGFGLGFDPRGRLWVGNFGYAGAGCPEPPLGNSISLFDPEGAPLSPPLRASPSRPRTFEGGYEAGPIERPQGTVADLDGNVWVASCGGDSVTRYANGLTTRVTDLGPNGLADPFGVAVGVRGNVFVSGNGNDRVAVLRADGTRFNLVGGDWFERPLGVATDSRGYAWVANSRKVLAPCESAAVAFEEGPDQGTVTLLDPDGRPLGGFANAGLWTPWGVAVDGDDTVWVANFGGQRLSHICGARPRRCPAGKRSTGASISPAGPGYGFDGLTRNTGIAIDPSGNVWVANGWRRDTFAANPGGNQIVAFLGLAEPIATPLIGKPEQP